MFVEPDVASVKPLAKGDPTAPARSTIRRQRAPRSSANTRPEQRSPSSFRSHLRRQTGREHRARDNAERTSLEDSRRRMGDPGHPALTGAAIDDVSSLERVFLQNSRSGNHPSDVGEAQLLRPSGSTALNISEPVDASHHQQLDHSRGGDNARQRSPPRESPPFPPSSGRLYEDLTLTSGGGFPGGGFPRRRHPTSDSLDRSLRRNGTTRSVGSAAYTPGFPPAHQLDSHHSSSDLSARMVGLATLANRVRDLREMAQHRQNSSLQSILLQLTNMMSRSLTGLSHAYLQSETRMICSIRNHLVEVEAGNFSAQETPRLQEMETAVLPPLRRMSHHFSMPETNNLSSRDPLRHGNLDGLGDRERSLSPEAISWETMLTTITPDDRIPSTNSSFTSATTSDSVDSLDSASTSASSRTHLTDPPVAPLNEPCPLGEWNGSHDTSQPGTRSEVASSHLHETIRDFLSHANDHLDRIELLSRLIQSRSQSRSADQHGSMPGHNEELQSLETTLQRLERYVQQERLTSLGFWPRPDGGRTGRERL